jgi:hypothetical protein
MIVEEHAEILEKTERELAEVLNGITIRLELLRFKSKLAFSLLAIIAHILCSSSIKYRYQRDRPK